MTNKPERSAPRDRVGAGGRSDNAAGGRGERAPGRTHAGRAPSLTARGQAWALGGGLLLFVGAVAGAWRVAALGVVSLAALGAAYVAFFPTSVLIWRRHLELLWRVERGEDGGGFIAGRPFRLTVTLRNRAPRALGDARLRAFTSSALRAPASLAMQLAAAHEATVTAEVQAERVGFWFLHGAAVEVQDRLGLCTVEAYFPSPLGVKVLPRPALRLQPAQRRLVAGAPHERVGVQPLRHRGLGGDLRELREHAPGDPFKQIAWKATARTGKLMVRELDRETMVTHWLLVDVAGTMRDGAPGQARLDLAVDVAAAYARGALEAGDRVALLTFDGRIVGEAKPNDGPVHRLRIVERLMEAMTVVDEDLTELTDSELIAVVARYLLLQEGIDSRLRRAPPIDDPVWSELAASPSGELYDLRVVHQAVAAALERHRKEFPAAAAAGEAGRLRLYCRLRGIELPWRRSPEAGRRARGLGAALERAAAARGSQRILVLSDLQGLEGDLSPVSRAVRLVRRRGHHLTFAAPESRLDPRSAPAAEIFGWHERRRESAAVRRLAGLGVRVVAISADNAATLLSRPLGAPRARVA
ncbi:MAG: hypothetical protein JWN44_2557 [Myxococcales bacterium]|nr:hypothetical protein [Myxococcales bacterium]